jgi:hypothetical protein
VRIFRLLPLPSSTSSASRPSRAAISAPWFAQDAISVRVG